MKGKRQEHAERRRPLAEINLGSQAKPRSTLKRSGCSQLLTLALAAAAVLALWVGLH